MNQSPSINSPPAAERDSSAQWQPLRGPFQRWPRSADFLLAVFSFFMTIAMFWSGVRESAAPEVLAMALLLFVVGNGALIWRRKRPLLVHLVVVAISGLSIGIDVIGSPVFAMAFSLYALGRYELNREESIIGLSLGLALSAIDNLLISRADVGSLIALGLVFSFWYIGRRMQFRGEYLRLLEERAVQAERQKRADAERAVAKERTRIARELHDIVAHQVSLMTVQASAAKTVADKDPQAAREAMASVEKAGRQALDELRHLLGVLRPEQAGANLGPQPGCADLPQLVAKINEAGLEITLSSNCDAREMPTRVDLAVYRIVQEALTNVLKHAGERARAHVKIAAGQQGVQIEVLDNGMAVTRLPGSGSGITGMRERAQLLGGHLEAGPMLKGGFQVKAYLPFDEGQR